METSVYISQLPFGSGRKRPFPPKTDDYSFLAVATAELLKASLWSKAEQARGELRCLAEEVPGPRAAWPQGCLTAMDHN